MIRLKALLLLCATSVHVYASSTASWEMSTYADFAKGRFMGLSLSRDGRMALAPKVDTLFASGQPAVWSIDAADDGTLYIGTGHRGRVYRVAKNGKADLLWNSPQPEVFAVTAGPDGNVYAGTSPSGKVYRIEKNGKATEYFDPKSAYIWALTFGPDGALYVGTGDTGRVFRVTKAGQGEIWYETGQSHVTALVFDTQGRLLAGSEPNGILYRISAKDKAFVLYDANLPEIRTITVSPDGAVYAAALGGSVAQRTGAAAAGANTTISTTVTAPPTSITVTEDGSAAQQPGPEIKPKPVEAPKAPQATVQSGMTVYTAPAVTGDVEKSAVYRINPDNSVETLWTSKEENVYDLLLAANEEVLFSTDSNGRIYRMGADRKVTLLVQTNEGETTRLIPLEDFIVAATSTAGRLLRIGGGAAAEGMYESPVHDAGSVSRCGQLSWRGQKTNGATLLFRTRSGNSARPDRTWSEWSEPMSEPGGSSMSSPSARFVQWRAEFRGPSAESPSVTGVTLSYLPQNNPPTVRSINVTTQAVPTPAGGKSAVQQQGSGTYSVTVTDTGEAGASSLSGTATQTMSRGMTQQIHLTWVADDPDGDRLVYGVWFRGEEESQWKLLRANFTENTFMLEGEVLADGKYLFRVVASDRQANAPGAAREADLVSTPVLFDNTPPSVQATATRQGTQVVLTVEASDMTSTLRAAEYSMNATPWVPLAAVDGVADGKQERFTATLDNVPAGEHLIVVRAHDSANNAGLTKVVVR
jgi:sugar lactone lactonase YvrE